MDRSLEFLKTIDYQGYLGLEILDRRYVMNPESAMKNALEWFKNRI